MSDFASVPNAVLEDWFLDVDKLERRLPSPSKILPFAKAIAKQINYLGAVYGFRHRGMGKCDSLSVGNPRCAAWSLYVRIYMGRGDRRPAISSRYVWKETNV